VFTDQQVIVNLRIQERLRDAERGRWLARIRRQDRQPKGRPAATPDLRAAR
jgi:hypothetical protein